MPTKTIASIYSKIPSDEQLILRHKNPSSICSFNQKHMESMDDVWFASDRGFPPQRKHHKCHLVKLRYFDNKVIPWQSAVNMVIANKKRSLLATQSQNLVFLEKLLVREIKNKIGKLFM